MISRYALNAQNSYSMDKRQVMLPAINEIPDSLFEIPKQRKLIMLFALQRGQIS